MCKIITLDELRYRSPAELQALYRKVQQELAISPPGSQARRAARISLENIAFAIARHQRCRRYPAPRLCP